MAFLLLLNQRLKDFLYMKIIKTILFILVILFGIFLFIYGGYDDSPGAQGLGLLIVVGSIVGIIKNRKSN